MININNKILKNNFWLICIILLLGFIAHSSMLPSTFKTLDDSFSIIDNADIKNLANTGKIFRSSFFESDHYYRPMVSFSFMIEYHLFGLRSFYFNLDNLLLHLLIAVSVFFLIGFIVKDRLIAFFTSLLFAVHPVQWEAVANIPGRAVILSAFFTVNAFLVFCLARDEKRPVICYVLSLILFACGLLSKESAAMLPILLLSYVFLIEKNNKRYLPILFYFGVIGAYLFVRYSLEITGTYPWRSAGEYVLGFLTFLRACLTYIRIIVWPVDLHFDRAQEMFLTFLDPELWITVIVFLIAIFILLKCQRKLTAVIVFFISWVCIELAPVSQIVTSIGVQPGYISAAEHFLYMPVIGAFVLLILAVKSMYELNLKKNYCSVNACRAVIVVFICFFMLMTARQGHQARTAMTMFYQTLNQNPKNVRILYSMGIEMVNRKLFAEGEQYFRRALNVDPIHLASRIALGRALHDQKKYVESIAVYESIHQGGRWDELLAQNLDDAYQGAIDQYQRWIADAPNNAQLYYSLGTMYSRSNRILQGVEQYKKAIAIDPNYKRALFNLASSYEAMGEEDLAIEMYRRMISVDGGDDQMNQFAQKQLSELNRRKTNKEQSIELLKKLNAQKTDD